MKELLLIRDSNANKISYFHLLFLMASLPFDRFYSHIILISFTIHTLINLRKGKVREAFTWRNAVLQSAFFVTLIATAYTSFLPEAFSELTLRLPILLLPVVLSTNYLDLKKYRPMLLKAFVLICTGTVIYLYTNAFYIIQYYHLPFKTIVSEAFTNHNFSQPIDMHATFFSLQLIIGLVYLLSLLFKPMATPLKIFYSFCCLVLVLGVVQLSSKSILAVLFIMVNLVIPYYLLKGKNRIQYMVSAIAISAIVIVAAISAKSFRDRYINSLTDDLAQAKPGASTDPRLARWHLVAELIKQKPLIGHGSGSEVPLLHEEFFKAKMYSSFLAGLNSHNQYLSFLVKSGSWGVLIYLFTLGYGFRVAFKDKDVVFISFMSVIAIVSLSENVLDADKGVMFYSLFFSFLLFTSDTKTLPITTNTKKPEYLQPLATNSLVGTSY